MQCSAPVFQWSLCRYFAGPPSARVPQNLTVVAGLDVYLRCPVAGFPISSVTWQRTGDILPIHLRQRVFSNGTLLVRKVEGATDRGEYSCSVSNQQGQSAHGKLYLDVMSRYRDYRLQENDSSWYMSYSWYYMMMWQILIIHKLFSEN